MLHFVLPFFTGLPVVRTIPFGDMAVVAYDPLPQLIHAFSGLLIFGGCCAGLVGFVRWLIAQTPKGNRPRSLGEGGLWTPPPRYRSACVVRAVPPATTPAANFPISNFPVRKTLESLSWQEFELVIGELYRRQGYEVEMCSGDGSDGGVDLRLRKNDLMTLVQCKHWQAYKVGVSPVRELFGILHAEKADHAIFVTTGSFTRDALAFAAGKPMDPIDGKRLQVMVEADQAGDLLEVKNWSAGFTQAATIIDPVCPSCRSTMVLRRGKQSGNIFWGCSTFPRCRGKRNMRRELMGS